MGVCLNHVCPPGDGLYICLTLFSRSWRRAKGLRLEPPRPPKAPPRPSRLPLLPKGTRPSPPCPPRPCGSPGAVGAPAAAPSLMRVSPRKALEPPPPLGPTATEQAPCIASAVLGQVVFSFFSRKPLSLPAYTLQLCFHRARCLRGIQ